MLTQEDDVEICALRARGWTVSAIARHTGRDRKTVRRYLAGEGPGQGRARAASCLEPYRAYIEARFVDDPHLPAVTLADELAEAGFDRSYPTLLGDALRDGDRTYTYGGHAASHSVTHETARTDLAALADQGLLLRQQIGRRYFFTAPEDLAKRLQDHRSVSPA